MNRKKYCGTAAKAGGNSENKPHPAIMGVPYLLEDFFSRQTSVIFAFLYALGYFLLNSNQ
jgi:hypothetical protein